MKKLVLHIGAHKTGTTSIQAFLKSKNQELCKAGWDFVTDSKWWNWAPLIKPGPIVRINEQGLAKLKEKLRQSPNNCLVSCEDLFFLNDIETVDKLRQCFSDLFTEIQVVVYLRRQLEAALSQKIQAAKTNPSDAIFGHDHCPLPRLTDHVRDYLEYHKKLSMWTRIFGEESLTVRWYERDHLVDGDAIADFLATTKLPLKARKMSANKSLGSQTAFFLHTLRLNGFPLRISYRLVAGNWIETDFGEKWLPSRATARAFQSVFQESNRQLAELTGTTIPFSSDFSRYPDSSKSLLLNMSLVQRNLCLVKRYLRLYYSPRILTLLRNTATRLVSLQEERISKNFEKCLAHLKSLETANKLGPLRLPQIQGRNGESNTSLRAKFSEVIWDAKKAEFLHSNAKLLLSAANKLESRDLMLSYQLMQLYVVYCPEDVSAHKRIAHYETDLRKNWIGGFWVLEYKINRVGSGLSQFVRRMRMGWRNVKATAYKFSANELRHYER